MAVHDYSHPAFCDNFRTFYALCAYIADMENEISFCELRKKEVVNAADGSKLGHIVDMIISVESKAALGIVAPAKRGGLFAKEQNIFIPLGCIIKIGADVILIDMNEDGRCRGDRPPEGCGGKCALYD